MRRASTCLAVLGLAVLALPSAASAVPTVTFKAVAVPISGFPNTGNIYGAGAAVQAEYTITGTEYGGAPPPLIGVNFYLPTGAKLHTQGFATCTTATLEQFGPVKCSKKSAAGPVGKVVGFVELENEETHKKEKVKEKAELSSFFSPGGGLEFFTDGHSPLSVEILSKAHYVSLSGGGGFGPELISEVPLVPSSPGNADVSVESINVKVGSAYKQGKKTVYYGTMPKKGQCPKAGFLVKTELIFAENAELSKPVKVIKTYRAPCPRK